MDQNRFPQDMPMEQILSFARSSAGRQLMAMLRQKDPQSLDQAARMAAAGDTSGAKDALSGLMADPKVLELLKQLGG